MLTAKDEASTDIIERTCFGCVLSWMYELLRTILADISLVRLLLLDVSSKYIICQLSLRGLRKGAHSFEDTYRSAFGGI